jgi:hypothetical protein
MSLASDASKILTNKYFLYFMVFISATNVLGYLVSNRLRAVIFFALVCFLTSRFSKNMSVILLVGLIATNFFASSRMFREGLENRTAPSVEKVSERDPDIAQAIPAVKNSTNNEQVKTELQSRKAQAQTQAQTQDETTESFDINNMDLNKSKDKGGPEGYGEKLSNNKKTKVDENFGPRLDYAATIEQSYQNLDNLLGTDSIKQLTTDTQKLMQQQQNLFNTMNQMVPVLEGAQNMLKGFDINGLANSLKGINSTLPKK